LRAEVIRSSVCFWMVWVNGSTQTAAFSLRSCDYLRFFTFQLKYGQVRRQVLAGYEQDIDFALANYTRVGTAFTVSGFTATNTRLWTRSWMTGKKGTAALYQTTWRDQSWSVVRVNF